MAVALRMGEPAPSFSGHRDSLQLNAPDRDTTMSGSSKGQLSNRWQVVPAEVVYRFKFWE